MSISQKIIWKYETPLQGEYLARSLYGGVTPGLVSPLDVEIDEAGAKISIKSSFQCYIRPDNYYDDENSQGLLVKVEQEISEGDILSYAVLEDNAIALGIRYTWVSDTSQEAVIETLYYDDVTDDLTDYKGVILCCFDKVNKRVYPNMADFTLAYSQTIPALSGVGYRGLLPREFSNATTENTADRNIQALVRYLQYSEGLVKATKTVVPVSAVVGSDRISKTFYISTPEYIKVDVCRSTSFPAYQILSYTNTYYVNSDEDVPESLTILYSDLSESIDKIGLPSEQTALVALKRSSTIFNSQDDSVVDVSGSGVGSSDGASTFDNQIITERVLVSDVDVSGNVAANSSRGLYINKDVLYFSPSGDFATEKPDQIYQNGSPTTLLNSYMVRALFHCQPFSFNKQLSATNTGTTEVFSNAFYFGFPDFSIAFGDEVPYSVSVDGFEGSFSVGRKLPDYGKDCFCFWYGYNLSPSVYGADEVVEIEYPDTWIQCNGVWYEPVKTIDDFSVNTTQDITIKEYNGYDNIGGMWNRPNNKLQVTVRNLPPEDRAHKVTISNIGSAGEDTTGWLMEMTLTYSRSGDDFRGIVFFDNSDDKLDRVWCLMRNSFNGRVGNGMAFRVGPNNEDESSKYTIVANKEIKLGFLFNGAVQGDTADFFFDEELKEVLLDHASILTTKSPAIIDGSLTLRFAQETNTEDPGVLIIKKIAFYKPYKPVVVEGSTVSTRCCGSGSNRFYPPTDKSFVPEISRLTGPDVFKGSSYTLRDYNGNTRAIYYQSKALSQVQANGMIIDKNSLVPERHPDWYFGVFDLPVYPPDVTGIEPDSWDTEKDKPKYRFIDGALSACEVIAQATIDPTQRFMRFLKSSPFTSYSAGTGVSRGLQESISCIDIVHFGHSYCYGFVEDTIGSISKELTLDFSAKTPDTIIYTIGDLDGRAQDKVLDYNYYIECSGTGTGYLNIKTTDKTYTFKPLVFIKNRCDSTISVRYGNNSLGVDIPASESVYLVSFVSAKGDLMRPRVYVSPVFSYFADASEQVSDESMTYSYATSFAKGLYLGMSFNQRMPMIYSKMEYEGEGSKEFDWTKPAMFQYLPKIDEGGSNIYWAVFAYQEMWADKRKVSGSVPCFAKRVYSGVKDPFHFGSIIEKYKNLVSNVPKGLSSDPDVSFKENVYTMPTFDFPEAQGSKCNPYIMHCVVPYGTSFNLDYYGTETGHRCGIALSQATVIPYSANSETGSTDMGTVSGLLYSSLDTSLRETGGTFFGTVGSEDGYFCLVANDADKVVTNLFRSTTFLNIVEEVVVPKVAEEVQKQLGDLPNRVTEVETGLSDLSTEVELEDEHRYRYDFVVDDGASWQKFMSNNMGDAKSVLIRKGIWTSTTKVTLRTVKVRLEEGASVKFNAGFKCLSTQPAILSGGEISGSLENCRVYDAYVVLQKANLDVEYVNTVIENSFGKYDIGAGSVTGGTFCKSVVFGTNNISNAKFVDCQVSSVNGGNNTYVRCKIPDNSRLTNSTVIECDYSITLFSGNVVSGTTFHNCNLSFTTTSGGGGTVVVDGSNYAYNSKLKFDLYQDYQVCLYIYDSEILYTGDPFKTLKFTSFVLGASYMNIGTMNVYTLVSIISNASCSLLTSFPFFRENNYSYYILNPDLFTGVRSTLYPGVVCIVRDNDNRDLVDKYKRHRYFISFAGEIPTGPDIIAYGDFNFVPWANSANDLAGWTFEFVS